MVLLSVAYSTKVYPPTTIQGKSTNTTVNQTAATPTPSAAAAPPTRNPELEFPATNYYELESRVHTDQWTIPFRQDESLAICLRAAIKMLHHDLAYSDEQCISFMERTLPDAFYKVTTQILSNGAWYIVVIGEYPFNLSLICCIRNFSSFRGTLCNALCTIPCGVHADMQGRVKQPFPTVITTVCV